MIDILPDLPGNVLGISAKGMVTAKDYEEVVIPAVESLFRRQATARFLYHLGENFKGFEAAAMWDDAKLGLKHLAGWERVAVVSDLDWLRVAVKVFALAMPGHVRVFHNRELADATRWVAQ